MYLRLPARVTRFSAPSSRKQARIVSGVCAVALHAFDDVDELVDGGVLAEEHLRVVDAILCAKRSAAQSAHKQMLGHNSS